ncbi:DUF4233 domain-containing protein [Phytomonospora sp. NPDC050363]|uniref:DUF4233 domain-containing protein n=1 Tax=Phytomonospora sp. NPDC050363 TaxID=3155642 RepID=UPI0033E45992
MEQVREEAVDQTDAVADAESGTDPATESGLRNPERAARGLGAMVLALEALVLLLAIAPLNMLDVPHLGLAITVVLVLVVAAVVLAGMMKRPWAWLAGGALQVALLPCAVFHWSLAAIGVVFGLVWLYSLHVRKVLSRPPVRES